MTDLIHREMEEVFFMVTGGISVAMIFDAYRFMLTKIRESKRLYAAGYLFCWLCMAYLFCQFLYQGSYGKISWYTLPAFALGCILWKKGFCGIINLYANAQKHNGDENNE